MTWRRALPWIILSCASAALVVHALFYSFVCDDAYITFRYSYNLAFNNELAFNLGERVEGYTNFLWTVLLAGFMKLGLKPEVMSQVLGSLFGSIVLICVYVFTRIYRGGKQTGWDFLAVLILSAMAGFAVWCSGGLETQLFTALSFSGMTLYIAEHSNYVQKRWSGFVFALSAMTRPEGIMLFVLTGLHWLVNNLFVKKCIFPSKKDIFWILGFVIPFGLYFAWRYFYFGYLFPNTFYVKAGESNWLIAKKWGFLYLWDFVHHNKLYVLAPFILFFRPQTAYKEENVSHRGVTPAFVWTYVAVIMLCYTSYIVWVGGDFMTMGRFFVPILPLLAFLAQEVLREVVERFPRREPQTWRPIRMIPVAFILIGLLIWNSTLLYKANQKQNYYRWGLDTIAYLKKFADDRILIGTWMRQIFPKDTYISVGGAGAIVYASRFKALDSFGLNNEWIAHKAPRGGDRPGHGKFAPESYVLEQKPDLICHIGKHQDYQYRPSHGEEKLWQSRGYKWVCLTPPGLRPSNYCCLKRIDRKF